MSHYTVIVTMTDIEAEDHREAAKKAYSLLNDITPTYFAVKNAAAISQDVELTEDETEQALKHAFEGNLFPKE